MRRLYSRIYLHFLVVLLVVGIAASTIVAFGARRALRHELAERAARHVTSLVAERVSDAAALGRRLAQIHADLEIDVTVRAVDGRVIGAAGPELPAPAGADDAALRAGSIVVHPGPRWLVAAPVRDPATGSLVAIVVASAERRERWGSFARPAVIVGAVLLIVALATAPLARRISRPIERLTEAARRFGGGDLTARVPDDLRPRRRHRRAHARRPGELDALTGAFNEMAERVERLVRGHKDLLANVSHELRSPLARIRVALELLPHDPGVADRLGEIERDLSELDQMIDEVLTISRLDAIDRPPHVEAVDVPRLLAALVDRARHDPVVGGRAVEITTPSTLPVLGDETLLKAALWNLVENAAKYGAPPITLAAERRALYTVLSVSDTGPGIPPDDRPRIFESFYRGDKARTPGACRGVGLGLAMVRRVAELHGGAVSVGPASTDGGRERGCRVELTIPVAGPSHPPSGTRVTPPSDTGPDRSPPSA